MSEPIPVLTLWQPWASLVALGVKTIETRSWSTEYRGRLAIHAAAKRPLEGGYFGNRGSNDWWYVFTSLRVVPELKPPGQKTVPLPLGAIIGTVTLVDVVPTERIVWDLSRHPPYMGYGQPRIPPGSGAFDTLFASESQRRYGNFEPGRYAWLLADAKALPEPVPFRGGQRLTRKWSVA